VRAERPAIIKCVMAAYPDKLRAGVSSSERLSNMEFLRNRVIETGICAGMDIGLNLKRGGPSISVDAIVWRHGYDDIIDIGFALRRHEPPLVLQWVPVNCAVLPGVLRRVRAAANYSEEARGQPGLPLLSTYSGFDIAVVAQPFRAATTQG
jgi:hypothetical protein